MKKLIFFISMSVALSQSVNAATWSPLTGGEKMDVQIDTDSIVSAGGVLIKAWVTHSFSDLKASRSYPVFYYKSAMILEVYNCSERTSATVQELFYSGELRTGDVVKSHSYARKDLEFIDVAPGTIGEGSLEFACRFVKSKKK